MGNKPGLKNSKHRNVCFSMLYYIWLAHFCKFSSRTNFTCEKVSTFWTRAPTPIHRKLNDPAFFLFYITVRSTTQKTAPKSELSWFFKIIYVNGKFSLMTYLRMPQLPAKPSRRKSQKSQNVKLLKLYNFGINIFFVSALFKKLFPKNPNLNSLCLSKRGKNMHGWGEGV